MSEYFNFWTSSVGGLLCRACFVHLCLHFQFVSHFISNCLFLYFFFFEIRGICLLCRIENWFDLKKFDNTSFSTFTVPSLLYISQKHGVNFFILSTNLNELIVTKSIIRTTEPAITGAVSKPIRRTSSETKLSLVIPICKTIWKSS